MNQNFRVFTSLCDELKQKEAISFGVNEIESELLKILKHIKNDKENRELIKQFLIQIVKGIKLYPLEIIIFCMRELQWEEIKEVAIYESKNTNDWRIISSMKQILAVYDSEWEDADMYEYYSKKIRE